MSTQDEHDDQDFDPEEGDWEGVYIVDDQTADLLASAISIIHMMAGTQLNEESRENLEIIADELQTRFAIEQDSMIVREFVHVNPDTGEEELLYKPPGGVMGDDPDEESEQAEGPAPE